MDPEIFGISLIVNLGHFFARYLLVAEIIFIPSFHGLIEVVLGFATFAKVLFPMRKVMSRKNF